MAPATKSSSAKRSSSSSSSKRSGSNSGSTARKSSASSKNGSSKAESAGQSVAAAASKAKTPLIAGGAAIAGAAGGLLVKNRINASKGPMQKLRRVSLPKPNGKLNLSKVDLTTMKSTAERISSFGQQAADIAAAAEKTRKKNK
jgi:hypothetical protein